MITKLMENNKKKADKYWPYPDSVDIFSGRIKVSAKFIPKETL